MLYKLALSEPRCISGKFVANLSYRLGKVCRHMTKNGLGLSYRFCYGVVKPHLVATRRGISYLLASVQP
jgi:hypothetical protein